MSLANTWQTGVLHQRCCEWLNLTLDMPKRVFATLCRTAILTPEHGKLVPDSDRLLNYHPIIPLAHLAGANTTFCNIVIC